MDLARFAAMSRFLAELGTRRGLVRRGFAVLGLGALGVSGGGGGSASPRRVRRRRNRRKRKPSNGGGGGGLGAANCTVCDDGDDCPFTSIQAAIEAAAAGGTITVCKGTYTEDITIHKNLAIVADFGEDVELEGTGRTSVVTVEIGVTATISGMVIRDGVGYPFSVVPTGGGIMNLGGDLTVTNSVIENNEAVMGGGIFNSVGARLTLDNTVVAENTAAPSGGISFGGGIFNQPLAEVVLINGSLVHGNTALRGGGIRNEGLIYISGGSAVVKNEADTDGGGIHNFGGAVIVDGGSVEVNIAQGNGGGIFNTGIGGKVTTQGNSRLRENEAELGGGVYNDSHATLEVIDTAVASNEADEVGGGKFNGGGHVSLEGSTVFDNDANETAGGIFNAQGGVVALDNQRAVVDNKPNNCVGTNACGA